MHVSVQTRIQRGLLGHRVLDLVNQGDDIVVGHVLRRGLVIGEFGHCFDNEGIEFVGFEGGSPDGIEFFKGAIFFEICAKVPFVLVAGLVRGRAVGGDVNGPFYESAVLFRVCEMVSLV